MLINYFFKVSCSVTIIWYAWGNQTPGVGKYFEAEVEIKMSKIKKLWQWYTI